MPAQVEQDARPGGGDGSQRGVELIPAVAPVRTEGVPGEALAVQAHDRRLCPLRLAHQHGHMRHSLVRVRTGGEDAVIRGQEGLRLEDEGVGVVLVGLLHALQSRVRTGADPRSCGAA